MSGPVNVLAVMDDRIQQGLARADHRRGKAEPLGVIELRQARAAVAELIEAATEGVVGGCLCDTCERTRAALSRCRGEA